MNIASRLSKLEAFHKPRGRRVCVWGMTTGADFSLGLMTEAEIEQEVSDRRRLGTISPSDVVDVVSWQLA